MPINKYVLEITDNGKAVKIDRGMNFYGLMRNYEKLIRDSYTTSWKAGEGTHEWEEKIYTFTELKKIKVKLRLNALQDENNIPIRDKEPLEIIITKKRGGALGGQEIKNIIDKIEKTTGIWEIENL